MICLVAILLDFKRQDPSGYRSSVSAGAVIPVKITISGIQEHKVNFVSGSMVNLYKDIFPKGFFTQKGLHILNSQAKY
jgi:hypothetical protein